MKDVLIGLVIIIVVALVADFIYTEQNTCVINNKVEVNASYKCGFLKKQMDIDIKLFDRYW